MSWQGNHSSAALSALKIPVDDGSTAGGAYKLAAELIGPAGAGLTLRGAWTASTAYAIGDVVTYQNSSYAALSAFISDATFNPAKWQILVAVDAKAPSGLTAIPLTDGVSFLVADGSDDVGPAALSGLPAYLQSKGTDLASATLLSTYLAGDEVLINRGGQIAFLPATALPGGAGSSGGTTAVAPGQVGSLAAGTPTSMTIPVTYAAPSGTAPITYQGQTSPHGANTWTANGGTFSGTGGTFTGLTASTSYDLRIIATNSAGSSTTSLTSGITTAAAAAAGHAISYSQGPVYDDTNPLLNSGSLTGPSIGATAAGAINLGAGNANFCITGVLRVASGALNSNLAATLIGLSDGTNTVGAGGCYGSLVVRGPNTNQGSAATVIPTGTSQQFAVNYNAGTQELNVTTGGKDYNSYAAETFTGGTNCSLVVNLPTGVTIDSVRVDNVSLYSSGSVQPAITAAQTAGPHTVWLGQFEQDSSTSSV